MSSFERAFGDAPPETVWTTTGSGHVFEIKRHVEDFIDRVVRPLQSVLLLLLLQRAGEATALPAIRQAAVYAASGRFFRVDSAGIAPLVSNPNRPTGFRCPSLHGRFFWWSDAFSSRTEIRLRALRSEEDQRSPPAVSSSKSEESSKRLARDVHALGHVPANQ